jgi:hypothetical protein
MIMKTTSFLITFWIISSQFQCLAQPLGFLQSECGIIVNPHYTYENYQIFPHNGGGYRLYHNGILIHQEEWYESLISAEELKFIDDTTGFLIVMEGPISSLYVYKIINNSVFFIGDCPGYLFNTFVISRHTIYLASWWIYPPHNFLFITKHSDLKNEKSLLSMDTIVPDTTFHDTILGLPFCQGLNRLDFLYKYSNDTLNYTILFITDTLANVFQQKESVFKIAPNPASNYIRIISPINENFKSILILDNLGRKRKYLISENTSDKVLYIGDLNNGVYFLIIENGYTKRVYKFIKN